MGSPDTEDAPPEQARSRQGSPLYLCVPNFSEGRDRSVVAALVASAESAPVTVMDWSMDHDHHRSVIAFFGSADAIIEAVLAAGEAALNRINLPSHKGVHPRFGTIDVVPIVPLRDATMDDAVELSRLLGLRIGSQLRIPVFLYESSASSEGRANLTVVRRIGDAGLRLPLVGMRAPDFGPSEFHPTAGACAVGARGPLIAYNVNLGTEDPEPARCIACEIRSLRDTGGGMEGVKAFGFPLFSRSVVQVSTNVTRPERCRPRQVFDFVAREAEKAGTFALESELIGVISQEFLPPEDVAAMRFSRLKDTQFIEHWLSDRLP